MGEGLSMQTCNIKEEWMDLEDLDFDVVVDVFNNNNSDKGFQRQQSFLDILTDLTDYKDEEQGIDRAETAINSDNTFNNASSLRRSTRSTSFCPLSCLLRELTSWTSRWLQASTS